MNLSYTDQATFGDQHTRTIRSICWSPDGQLLASAGFDSQICIWLKKGDTFDFVAVMDGHENEVGLFLRQKMMYLCR